MDDVDYPCTALADRKWAWIVAEVDAGVDNDVLKQIEMLENSRDGLKTIRTRGTLKYCHVGIKSHLSIRHTKGRIAQQYQFRREPWLCVLSQYVPEINVGNINQCVVCGGGICRHKEASEILYRITNDIRSMKIS